MDTFLAILCAVPFIYSEVNLSVVDAIFESMSGITTTGATILNNLDQSPKGILIWRAILQWLGGNWNHCYSTCNTAVFKNWWNATVPP